MTTLDRIALILFCLAMAALSVGWMINKTLELMLAYRAQVIASTRRDLGCEIGMDSYFFAESPDVAAALRVLSHELIHHNGAWDVNRWREQWRRERLS